jgi:hypothetical protein
MRTITLPFVTETQRTIAAQFIAELARQGVTFKAEPTADGVEFVVTLTGGF